MFGKLMNNFYYGKAGKADYTPDDLPKNRWELFWEMLRTRLSALMRLNLMYVVVWLPMIILMFWGASTLLTTYNYVDDARVGESVAVEQSDGSTVDVTYISSAVAGDYSYATVFYMLLFMIPCIAITGPATAGVSYVTRNWARDEHAFIWSDFKDAVKANWKQSIVISLITGMVPFVVFVSWRFYGQMAAGNPLYVVPQVMILVIAIVWTLCVTYMYPLLVTYELKLRDVLRNALLLGIARLPMSIGIRLLHMLPIVLCILATELFGNMVILLLVPALWYVLLGFTLSRFITASYTNGVFDKYINSRIQGVQVNRGLAADDDDDDEEEEPQA